MEAGRALDALIARRLWKAIIIHEDGDAYLVGQQDKQKVPLPHYSTDIEDNQRVIAKLHHDGWTLRIHHEPRLRVYRAVFHQGEGRWQFTDGTSATHAVCLAALAALAGQNRV